MSQVAPEYARLRRFPLPTVDEFAAMLLPSYQFDANAFISSTQPDLLEILRTYVADGYAVAARVRLEAHADVPDLVVAWASDVERTLIRRLPEAVERFRAGLPFPDGVGSDDKLVLLDFLTDRLNLLARLIDEITPESVDSQ